MYQTRLFLVQNCVGALLFRLVFITFAANSGVMNKQRGYLQLLFNDYVFAGSDNKLASLLGYGEKSRSTIGRIKRGERVSDEKIAEIWERLCETFFIGDDDIAITAECVSWGHTLLAELQAEFGVGDEWHAGVFEALVTENYDALPPGLGKEYFVHLHEMKLQMPLLYFGMLAYCYLLCKGITPYTVQGARALYKQLGGLVDMLSGVFPTNSRARQAAEKVISFELAGGDITILKLIYNVRVIFGNYIEEGYYENYLRENGHLLDVGDDSFWVAPGSAFGEGCEMWYFSVVETKSRLHGSYIAMRLRATSGAIDSFELVDSYNFMFLVAADKDCTQILQAYNLPTGEIDYAVYGYDYDTRLLTLSFDAPLVNAFGLPPVLQCIDKENVTGREAKVWARVINEMLGSGRWRELLMSAVNLSAESDFEYLTCYDIVNVAIDRKAVTVTVEKDGEQQFYSIPLTAYPFLAKISPMEFLSVTRSKSSGKLFFSWNNLGQFIPFSEFELL